jgi:hypothetical protein
MAHRTFLDRVLIAAGLVLTATSLAVSSGSVASAWSGTCEDMNCAPDTQYCEDGIVKTGCWADDCDYWAWNTDTEEWEFHELPMVCAFAN